MTALDAYLPPALATRVGPLFNHLRSLYRQHGEQLPPLVVAAFLLLLALQLGRLFWALVPLPQRLHWQPAPATSSAAPAAPFDVEPLAGAHLFGEYQIGSADAASLANAPDTQLNFTLLGILAGTTERESRALIAKDGGDEAPYMLGEDVAPGVTLQAIFIDRVILARNGRLETLRLDKEAPSNAAVANTLSTGDAEPGSADSAAMLAQIRQQVVTDPSKAANFIRVQPLNIEGGIKGYRIYPGPERGPFNAAGLKPGDVVTAINGVTLDDPGKALQLLQSLATASQLSLAVERNGAVQSVNLSLTP